MRIAKICLLGILIVVGGCASKPEDIQAVAYPDEAYANLSCEQIAAERMDIQDKVLDATGKQKAERKSDVAWGWTGALLFAPALLMMDGNEETATRLAILKGQYESIERVSAGKRCVGNQSNSSN
ncbi:hypothetical protein N8214_03015 [Pseudomonadales bacterium]|jgi:hypothetical protein|nr:hypothetical protein [Pseudomonadales bacterium]